MSEGPNESTVDGAVTQAEEEAFMEGFVQAIAPPADAEEVVGEPEEADAVEEGDKEEEPAVEPEKAEEPPGEKGGDDPQAPEVNFDGFSQSQAATWKRLLEAGQVTKEEVSQAREESMFHSDYTKKTMALADKRREWEGEVAGHEDDFALLEKIRGDDHLHEAWLRMSRGEVEPDESGGDLVDAKMAAEIADRRYEERQAEMASRTKAEQAKYDTKRDAMQSAVMETMKILSIPPEQMQVYLAAEESALPEDADPILAIPPERLLDRVKMRHEVALAKAEVKALKEQLGQKTSKDERTSRQSLPPARRVSDSGKLTPLQQTEADLGIDPEWSNVQGFGHRDTR